MRQDTLESTIHMAASDWKSRMRSGSTTTVRRVPLLSAENMVEMLAMEAVDFYSLIVIN